jgi:hypothetical protein
MSEQLISLGLTTTIYEAQRLIKTLKAQGHLGEDFLTLNEFMRCFEPDKVGSLF